MPALCSRPGLRARAFGVCALGWLAACGLSACNGVLGIHEPSDQRLDGGVRAADYGDPADAAEGDPDAGDLAVAATAWAEWPMPNPTATGLDHAQSYQVDDGGVVVDEVTNLEWQREVDGELHAWRDAEKYCKSLDLAGGGFHLPTRIELLSLVDFTKREPSIDTGAFVDAPASYFWSASRFVGRHSLAWLVNFGAGPGFVSSSDLNSSYAVRCVRPASTPATRQFTAETETVADSGTDLVWQRNAPDATYVLERADAYCTSLELPGEGWRLPTIKELMTIVDEARSAPAIDRIAFPDTGNDYVWTSSRVADKKRDAWAVSFRYGFDGAFRDDTEQHVRCVRSE